MRDIALVMVVVMVIGSVLAAWAVLLVKVFEAVL